MAGMSVASNQHLIRSDIWSRDIKRLLEDDLMAMKYVRMLQDFPDGDTIHIPSIGQAETQDYEENQAPRYTSFDTGEFTFSIDQYKATATYVTEKFKQDSFYASEVISQFVPKMQRALAVDMETRILGRGPAGQTASNANVIDGYAHRWIGSGTNETIAPQDFELARLALMKANVPLTNLVAIVDPTVEYAIASMPNLLNLSMNKQWEGIVREGVSSGMRFRFNIFGWDVYISNYLPTVGVETIGSRTTASGAKANLFFSAAGGDVNPFIGLVRQAPRVFSEFNKDLQRDEYLLTCRYGFKLYRPENMVCILTDTDQVASAQGL